MVKRFGCSIIFVQPAFRLNPAMYRDHRIGEDRHKFAREQLSSISCDSLLLSSSNDMLAEHRSLTTTPGYVMRDGAPSRTPCDDAFERVFDRLCLVVSS